MSSQTSFVTGSKSPHTDENKTCERKVAIGNLAIAVLSLIAILATSILGITSGLNSSTLGITHLSLIGATTLPFACLALLMNQRQVTAVTLFATALFAILPSLTLAGIISGHTYSWITIGLISTGTLLCGFSCLTEGC